MWFSKLETSSIDCFEQQGSSFECHFVGGQRQKRPTDHLLTVRQGDRELLRSYVKLFTRDVLEVDEADDKVQSRVFVVALMKSPLQKMAEMLLKAWNYMNAEDALAAIGEENKPKEKESTREDQKEVKERKERSLELRRE